MENRAYSVLHVKSMDEEDDARVIRGIATTPTPDRVGDVVEPDGVKFQNPMPLLWQHRADMPVGTVKFDKPTKKGITFEARFAKAEKSETLKARIEEAWESVKLGLVSAVSIGFRSLEHAVMKDGGYRFIRSEVYELSLVTIPANADATIQMIKSVDQAMMMGDTSLSVGDRVKVKPGMAHEGMEDDMEGEVAMIGTAALGIRFDGMPEVHKWYIDAELEKVSSDEKNFDQAALASAGIARGEVKTAAERSGHKTGPVQLIPRRKPQLIAVTLRK